MKMIKVESNISVLDTDLFKIIGVFLYPRDIIYYKNSSKYNSKIITSNAPYQYNIFELINLSFSGLSKLVNQIELSSLFYFSNISLTLGTCNYEDFETLSNLEFLKNKIIAMNFITGINNYDLEDININISYNPEIHYINKLATYNNLKELSLEYTLLPTIPALPEGLVKLSLHQSSLGEFELINCTNLVYLDISCTGTEDITCLRKCKKLEHLNCDMTNISCIYPLIGLKHLRIFSANKTLIRSIRGLRGSQNALERIDVSMSAVEVIDILDNFTKLKYLNIGSTIVKSLQALQGCLTLEILIMEVTEIESLLYLANCINLRSLDIGYSYVDILEIKLLDKLRDLNNIRSHLDLKTNYTPLKRVYKTLQIISI